MGSPAVRPDDQYGQLLDRLVDRMADIAAATARAVRASIPAYDKVWDVVGPAVERVVLETNLHLVDMWRTGYRPDAEQLARLGRIGLPRAELGISIEEVLHAYRISAETLITALSEISKTYRDIDPQRLLNTALTEVQFLNDLSMAVWQEAMARQRAGVRRRDEVERHLISALISRPPRIDEAARLGRLIGMPALGGPWSVIAMSQGTVTEPDDLADLVASVRHALLPANNEYVCGIIDREVVIVTRPLRDPDVLSRVPCAAYGVGAARSGPGSVLETYGEAREALKVALKNGMRYAHIDQIWLDRLLHGSLTPLELADRILAPIAHLPAARRLELERTLDTYLIVDRRITEAARRLHLHPHTVRYRLEQLRQHLGEIMDSHDQRLALQIALRARRATRQER